MRPTFEDGGRSLKLYSTCPQSKDMTSESYKREVIEKARLIEQFDFHGLLVYTDNGIVDPWMVAQLIIEHTDRVVPLVAVQPVYSHPYTVAKMITTLAFLHARRVDLNMLAGGFRNDLLALDDPTPHDERYRRMVEYTRVIMGLLTATTPFTFEGRYFTVRQLRLQPPLPPELLPTVLVSGSSDEGRASAETLGAVAVKYPLPAHEEALAASPGRHEAVRVGVLARPRAADAWAIAHERFPADRRGELTQKLAMKVSDSSWHAKLAGHDLDDQPSVYWLHPFQTYKTFCPYLVGSYDEVAHELATYLTAGFDTFILDIPHSDEELRHTAAAFAAATVLARSAGFGGRAD